MLSRYPLETLRQWLHRCHEVAVVAEHRVEQINALAVVRLIENEIERRVKSAGKRFAVHEGGKRRNRYRT